MSEMGRSYSDLGAQMRCPLYHAMTDVASFILDSRNRVRVVPRNASRQHLLSAHKLPNWSRTGRL